MHIFHWCPTSNAFEAFAHPSEKRCHFVSLQQPCLEASAQFTFPRSNNAKMENRRHFVTCHDVVTLGWWTLWISPGLTLHVQIQMTSSAEMFKTLRWPQSWHASSLSCISKPQEGIQIDRTNGALLIHFLPTTSNVEFNHSAVGRRICLSMFTHFSGLT